MSSWPALVTALALAVAGGLGAVCRMLVDRSVSRRVRRFPLGILVVNVLGSLLFGVVSGVGLSLGIARDAGWLLVLTAGLLGGFTTYSTAMLDTVRLLAERRFGAALANSIGMLGVSVLALIIGLVVTTSLMGLT